MQQNPGVKTRKLNRRLETASTQTKPARAGLKKLYFFLLSKSVGKRIFAYLKKRCLRQTAKSVYAERVQQEKNNQS